MRPLRDLIIAGIAIGAIGVSGALAQSSDIHLLTVRLPGGGLADIRYSGDVPPHVVFRTGAAAQAWAPDPFFGAASPFAMLDRISAEMNREAAAMFRQADVLTTQARAGQLTEAALRNLPPGSQSYSFISTMSGTDVCTRSVEITSQGSGAAPRVVSHSSGNCSPGNVPSVNLPVTPARAKRPDLILTNADQPRPYTGMVRQVAATQR